ncbi:MAG: hypothetical protein EXS33_08315 [Pedosphaera sp.]|nr:hypothetical protein [Pedosphaera sp.]
MNWLMFALMTVVSWGLYGIYLHQGQLAMADKVNGRYKAFLFVGLAYFLTAVLAPLVLLLMRKAEWSFPAKGMGLSLFAGILGAIGAFCVLLAFGAKGTPTVVMSIIFAGAPVVNALFALWLHPPAGGLASLRPQFFLGILLAAAGGCLVSLYKDPKPAPPANPPAVAQSSPAPTGR